MTNRRTLFAIACLGMLAFGIVLTTLGAVLPSVIPRFGLDTTAAGALLLLMSFGILVGSVVFGPMVDRYGYKGMLLSSATLIVVGLEGIALAPSVAWLRVAILVVGFGGGIINGGTNALVADVSTESRGSGLSLLGVFFGIGAVGVPFTLGSLVGRFSYAAVIAGAGAVVLVPIVLTVVTRFPAAKQERGFPIADAGRLLRDPLILLFGAMLFLESGMEITVGGWTATFFRMELGLAADRALYVLSLYWFGMMVARMALGWLLRRAAPARVLLGCLTMAIVGALLLVSTHSVGIAAGGVFLIGAGFAASYPVILAFAGDRYAELSGTAFGVIMVISLTGGTIMPYVTGALGAAYGLRLSFLIVPAALVLFASLLAVATRRMARPVAVAS